MSWEDTRFYALALHLVPGIGPMRYRQLKAAFGSPEAVFRAREADLAAVVGPRAAAQIAGFDLARAEAEWDRVRRLGLVLLTEEDEGYPDALRPFAYSPPVLYVRGDPEALSREGVAIVGTRRPTSYGRSVARKFAYELAAQGFAVISGGARGVDTEAHRSALAAGGITVAVLGSGLDRPYPPENRRLFAEILEKGGALVSEFPLGTGPAAENFPRRNRIISALAVATLVVEAGEQSGALITARWALQQGKEVYAVPGNITSPQSRGTNRLIKEGATPVLSPEDFLQDLGLGSPKVRAQIQLTLTPEETEVYEALSLEPVHVDDLAERLGKPPSEVLTLLLSLELKGAVQQLPGKLFVREA